MLSVRNLAISFDENHVLEDFNLDLESGDIFALLGESGSGKSCALRFIAGLDNAIDGAVSLDGNDLTIDGEHNVRPELREIGMVFQDYALFPHMTVFDNIGFGINQLTKDEKMQRVSFLLELIGLTGIEKKYPHQLSGGEQQRVSIARALLNHPKIKEIRGKGLMLAIELEDELLAKNVVEQSLENGLILFYFLFTRTAIRITPPLTISEEEIIEGCEIIKGILD